MRNRLRNAGLVIKDAPTSEAPFDPYMVFGGIDATRKALAIEIVG